MISSILGVLIPSCVHRERPTFWMGPAAFVGPETDGGASAAIAVICPSSVRMAIPHTVYTVLPACSQSPTQLAS